MAEMNNNPYLVGKKKKIKIDAFTVINYTFLTAFAILCILPCLYVLLASFADKSDQMRALANGDFFIIPLNFNFENYKVTLFQDKIFRAFGISLFVTAKPNSAAVALNCLSPAVNVNCVSFNVSI